MGHHHGFLTASDEVDRLVTRVLGTSSRYEFSAPQVTNLVAYLAYARALARARLAAAWRWCLP